MANSEKLDEGFGNYDINKEHLSLFDIDEEKYKIYKIIKERTAFYMYDSAEDIIRTELHPRFISALLDANERGRLLFIFGDKNTGKSFIMRYFASICKTRYKHYWKVTKDGRTTHPIIIRNLPHNIRSVEGFFTWLLDSLGNPVDSRQLKEWEKTKLKLIKLRKKIIRTLDAYETRILILDESQRLLRAGDKHQITEIFEALKDLTTKNHWDEEGCSNRPYFVSCGTSDCLTLLRFGNFIQGRVHTRPLEAISVNDYPDFLALIYYDYVGLGISSDWDLFNEDGYINEEIGLILHERTQGKAGLTVEIVRHAILDALIQGYEYPQLNHYKEVILEGTKYIIKYIIKNKSEDDTKHENQEVGYEDQAEQHSRKTVKVFINFKKQLTCSFGGCPRSKKPYKRPWYLINHYKTEHPEAEVYDEEGIRLDEN